MGLLRLNQFHNYQKTMVNFQVNNPRSMIWGYMGSGKTVVTLTTTNHLLKHNCIRGALILAPLRVVQSVWEKEARKWEHTKHLTFSTITGNPDRRMSALFKPADVYLTNYENLPWLAAQLLAYFINANVFLPFDMLVADEISKLKNSNTVRMGALQPLLPAFNYRTGLTGTPAPNGYIDLHGQYLVIDDGKRLGTEKSAYENAYFKTVGWGGYSHEISDNSNTIIEQAIADITLEMAEEDYADMPDLIVIDIHAQMPSGARKKYTKMENELFAELDNGEVVEVESEVGKINKLLQMSNGAVYTDTETKAWSKLHDAKLDVLDDILEEAAGNPVLLGYNFRTDAERICKRFKFAVDLTKLSSGEFNNAIQDFAAGRIKLLIGHPACLHADTQVFTENKGWQRIIDVSPSDRVHDGVEFVKHAGCQFSGVKKVIDVFGIKMTENHKLLMNNEWVEARYVENSEKSKSSARFTKWENSSESFSDVHLLRNAKCNVKTKLCQARKTISKMSRVYKYVGSKSLSYIQNMGWYEVSLQKDDQKQERRKKLCTTRYNGLHKMGKIQKLLLRYGRILFTGFNFRKDQQFERVLTGELLLGDPNGSTIEQTNQSQNCLQREGVTFGRAGEGDRFYKKNVGVAIRSGHDRGSSSEGLSPVYDLVNCGKRNRFLIRNDDGEIFISHNSVGHGTDGLQYGGSILAWYGLPWSLELYLQMNKRLHRQGQGKPVTCYRILCPDTMDEAVAMKLEMKDDTQKSLREAVGKYRSP